MNFMGDFVSKSVADSRQFSMQCFDLMRIFHWTYDEVMELPLPVFFSLIEYLNKTK